MTSSAAVPPWVQTASLLRSVNHGNLEMHPLLSIAPDFDTPVGLDSLAKATGSRGLRVFVPLNTPVTFEQTKAFSGNVAEVMEARIGDRVVARVDKRLRAGKVLVDRGQNDRHRSSVAAYALGAKLARPTVSHPSSASRSGFRAERHRHETDVTRAWREARLMSAVAAERALLGRRQGSSGCTGPRGRSGGAA